MSLDLEKAVIDSQLYARVLDLKLRAKTNGKIIDRKRVINRLNRHNFKGKDVTLIINDSFSKFYAFEFVRLAPCVDEHLCIFHDNLNLILDRSKISSIENLTVKCEDSLLYLEPDLEYVNGKEAILSLPENCFELNTRKIVRHDCDDPYSLITTNGKSYEGKIKDFCVKSFKVEIVSTNQLNIDSFSLPELEANVTIKNNETLIYKGDCRILRFDVEGQQKYIVLKPIDQAQKMMEPKKFRSQRLRLLPSPTISFVHPITGRIVNLLVDEISGSGFSTQEIEKHALLFPGMRIPQLELKFAGLFHIKCSGQVIHCRSMDKEDSRNDIISCGIAFTDMDPLHHSQLIALLQQAIDGRSCLSNTVEIEALWDFLFETGFIYPKKYQYLHQYKDSIIETFQKLYQEHVLISRHFMFIDHGEIKGHMGLQHVYSNTWMMHHHAAKRGADIAGFKVLSNVGSFINASYLMPRNRMKYAIVYYRPENKIPDKVFGGVARKIKNPKICSIDTFAYFRFRKPIDPIAEVERPYRLSEASQQDFVILSDWYDQFSSGLSLAALDLIPSQEFVDELSEKYRKAGFKRNRSVYSLKRGDSLQAVFMACVSNVGMNLSDLTNGVHVFIVDQGVERESISNALSYLSLRFEQDLVAINLYPVEYANKVDLKYDKCYTLWTMEMRYSDHYFAYLERLSRFFKS